MENKKITIIGGGNLGTAIAEGLIKSEFVKPQQITITRRKVQFLASLQEQGAKVLSNNIEAIADAHFIILAIKPKQIRKILEELKPSLNPEKHVLISVVTGVSIANMESIVGKEITLFRAMPNTAIAIRESMTCIATTNATEEQRTEVSAIFDQLGKSAIIDENLMAAATVLGASGIAYALRYIRAASQGGIEIGFGSSTAQLIAEQTVKGAASLLLETGHHPEQEIDKVTTPQGCTIAGLNEMEHQGFSSALIKGVKTSYNKIDVIKEDF